MRFCRSGSYHGGDGEEDAQAGDRSNEVHDGLQWLVYKTILITNYAIHYLFTELL